MVSYETIRRLVNHFGPLIAADLRKRLALREGYGLDAGALADHEWRPKAARALVNRHAPL